MSDIAMHTLNKCAILSQNLKSSPLLSLSWYRPDIHGSEFVSPHFTSKARQHQIKVILNQSDNKIIIESFAIWRIIP